MSVLLAAIGAGGWAIVACTGLLAALLFVPWKEPSRRAERLVRAWRGDDPQRRRPGRRRAVR
jgi:hypothetical protein